MEIRPIKTEADYKATLKEIEVLMSAEAGSPEGDRLDVLVTLVEAYERHHYTIDFMGRSRLISPAGESWDSWFSSEGVTVDFMQSRDQPNEQEREGF